MNAEFDANMATAVLGFNEESLLYCRGISDLPAQEYARNYARMLLNQAQGLEFSLPRLPLGMIEANRSLIRSTLQRMCDRYFPAK